MILAARGDQREKDRESLARVILKGRQRRSTYLPAVAFGEPGWDMILQLYVADCTGRPIDVSALCSSTGVPKTTALRHLDRLAARDLVERRSDDADGRRIFVLMGDTLRSQTERWLDATALALDLGPS